MTTAGPRVAPIATPDTAPFWEATSRGELALPRCRSCLTYIFYPRSHCPSCFSRELDWTVLSGMASLHSFVIAHLPAPGFDPPYVIAIVELAEGPRMMTNIVGVEPSPESLELDMALQVVFELQGDVMVPRFRPVDEGK
ncbi:Zn-ribbon domain-containing OB-fold protein [Sciscionella marina]|uniref:Zn-ribbon domain-containing OB-fold protein n=1 Tax=Sciscionella marina TaxID=508770 RepID=UPI000360EEC3|nr:OB-fold domain-containing protein [Sciscionella marina]